MSSIDCVFLQRSADEAAQGLLGCVLFSEVDGYKASARIVETEAYDQNDPASHAFHGISQRNRALFGPAGCAYVYVSHGMYHCCNITAGAAGFGAGVLLRAVEPLEGIDVMRSRRDRHTVELTNGPAKLCQALGVDMRLYGHDLAQPPLTLRYAPLHAGERILRTPRIGINKAKERLRRFVIADNPYLSKASLDIRRHAQTVSTVPSAG
jgi:DNA-3-methyladenine glycosylase